MTHGNVTKPRRRAKHACGFVGCLHLLPLCGSAGWKGSMKTVIDRCLRDLAAYEAAGVDGVILENTHDAPYLRGQVDPGTIAGLAAAAIEVRRRFGGLAGVQALAAADIAALEIAATCGLDFIRVEGFAYAHVADEGLIQGDAGRLVRRRAHLRAERVEIWVDVKKKHSSHAITADLPIREEAKGVVYNGADGLIVTGGHTGEPPSLEDVEAVAGLGARVLVGSGVNEENIVEWAGAADLLIVGSACKKGGDWRNVVERRRVQSLVGRLRTT